MSRIRFNKFGAKRSQELAKKTYEYKKNLTKVKYKKPKGRYSKVLAEIHKFLSIVDITAQEVENLKACRRRCYSGHFGLVDHNYLMELRNKYKDLT